MISKISKYTVEAELGRGGFGVVYRAYDPDVGRSVAIKVLTAESDSELLKRFQDEVGTTGNLTHKNIVVVHESGSESGVPYLVMELLSGRTLQDIVKAPETMSLLDRVRVMTQVAEGLKYAHARNVIHRDVKPSNVMILNDGNAKLMDFGIARVTTRSTVMTREGYIIGTIPYMAPEQFQTGGKADKQTDIFAYGVVYYELITGRHPFSSEDNVYGTIERIKLVEPESITRLIPECPEALELLIYRAIAKDRDVRYATFDELLLDSEAVLADLAHDRAMVILSEVPNLIEAGEIDAAEEKLKEAVELAPGNRDARQLRKAIQDEKERRKVAARLPALLEESNLHLKERRFGEAVQSLEIALRLTRNDESVQVRLSEARGQLDAHLQANKLLAEARRFQQKGQLSDAVERLRAALDLDSQHPDANSLFTRLDQELQRRQKDADLQQVIATASEHLTNKRYEEALSTIDRFGTEQIRLADLRARIERARDEEEGRKLADRFNVAVSEIRAALQSHELSRAEDLLDRLPGDFGDIPDIDMVSADLRATLETETRVDAIAAFSQQARDLIRLKWFADALNLLQEATERFPEDTGLKRLQESATALLRMQQRSEAIAQALEEANRLREANEIARALQSIADARSRIGNDRAFDDLQMQLQIEDQQQRYATGLESLLAKVRALTEAGDYLEAIRAVEAAPEYAGDSELRSALTSAKSTLAAQEEQKFVDSTVETAARLEEQEMLEQASGLLQDARQKYPYNRTLSLAAERIGESRSRKLREAGIAAHQRDIEQAIEAANWSAAEAAIERAQREYPGEPVFETLAAQVRRAVFDAGIDEAVSVVREKLAANGVSEAYEQLNVTRAIYSGDPRWKQVEQEVAQRKAYESGLHEADREQQRGNFSKAEEVLTALKEKVRVDARHTQMLAMVQDRLMSQGMAEANQAVEQGDFDRGLSLMETLRFRVTPEWSPRVEDAYEAALRRKEEALARLKSEQEIAVLAEQANGLAKRGEFGPALEVLAEGLGRFPESQSLVSLREALLGSVANAALKQARALYKQGDLEAALRTLQDASQSVSGNRELLDLRLQIEVAIERSHREQQLREVEKQAQLLLAQRRPADVIKLIENLGAGEDRFRELLAQARQELDAIELDEFLSRARALGSQGLYQQAVVLIEQGLGRYGQAETLQDLLRTFQDELDRQRKQQALADARDQLIALEQRVDTATGKKSLEELDQETQRIGSLAGEDVDVASIAERIHERIEAILKQRTKDLDLIRRLEQEGKFDAALKEARSVLLDRPEDTEFLERKTQIEARIEQEKRQRERERELQLAAKQAGAMLKQGKPEEAIGLIESGYRDEPSLEPLLTRARSELKAKQLDELLSSARAAATDGRLEHAIELIDRGITQHGQVEALIALRRDLQSKFEEKQRQASRAQDRSRLLALEEQAQARLRKGKLKQLSAEALKIGAGYPSDAELSSIALRIQQRVEAASAESAAASGIPWKPIAIGGTAAALVAAALIMLHRSGAPATVAVDLRSDPPGAKVSLGDRSCETPNCRFDLPPGKYQVHAELEGYQPAEQSLTIDPSKRPGEVDFILQPVPAPPLPPGAKEGTVLVQAGVPDAQVFVDQVPRGRTDPSGALRLSLAPAAHEIRVQRSGFENASAQRVVVADGRTSSVAFKMIPQMAKLELRGAPAGVEIRLGNAVVGRTDGSLFSAPIPAGSQMVQVIQGASNRQIAENFDPGRTVTLEWKSVAPSASPAQPIPSQPPPAQITPVQPTPGQPSPQPSAAMIEARDWEQVRGTSDPAQLETYLNKYPNGLHATEATQRLADAAWGRVDQNDPQSLRAFVAQNPNNSHRSQAQSLLDQIEKLKTAEIQKQERVKQLEIQKQLDSQRAQQAADAALKQQVQAALDRFNLAFVHKQQKELKAIWPNADKGYLQSVTVPNSGFKLVAAGNPELHKSEGSVDTDPGTATILCNAITEGQGKSSENQVRVTLGRRLVAGATEFSDERFILEITRVRGR